MVRPGLLIPVSVLAVACGSTVSTAGPLDAAVVDLASSDMAPTPDAAAAPDGGGDAGACRTDPCGPTQLCFRLHSSGSDGECRVRQEFDGGVCPPGWHVRTDGCHGPNIGCVPPRCLPYPPTCGEVPAACRTHPSCGCFAADPCQPAGTCAAVVNGHVTCTCM